MIKEEPNIRIEICIGLVAIGVSTWLKISMIEWCIILFCIGGVLTAEALNSSLERLADQVTKENHPNIANVKDMAAGGVLIMAIISVIVGALIWGPKLLHPM